MVEEELRTQAAELARPRDAIDLERERYAELFFTPRAGRAFVTAVRAASRPVSTTSRPSSGGRGRARMAGTRRAMRARHRVRAARSDARPIAKGRLGRPVEFGYKAQVVDNPDGVVLDHTVERGNPPDAPGLVPAISRIKARFGKAPAAVVADRGNREAAVDAGLEALGVNRVVIPRKGRPGGARQSVEWSRGFRHLVKWRTGSEARVSCLKRDYGWSRTLTDTEAGARTWCGWGVLAHNATKVARLAAVQHERQRAGLPGRARPREAGAA